MAYGIDTLYKTKFGQSNKLECCKYHLMAISCMQTCHVLEDKQFIIWLESQDHWLMNRPTSHERFTHLY